MSKGHGASHCPDSVPMDSSKADADVDPRVELTQKLIEVRDINAKQVNYAGQVSLANCSKVSKRTIGQP
jgi:hypothetical protein